MARCWCAPGNGSVAIHPRFRRPRRGVCAQAGAACVRSMLRLLKSGESVVSTADVQKSRASLGSACHACAIFRASDHSGWRWGRAAGIGCRLGPQPASAFPFGAHGHRAGKTHSRCARCRSRERSSLLAARSRKDWTRSLRSAYAGRRRTGEPCSSRRSVVPTSHARVIASRPDAADRDPAR